MSEHDDSPTPKAQRTKGLQRKTPLSRGTKGLSRGSAPLSRGNGLQRRTPLAPSAPRSTSSRDEAEAPKRNGLSQGSGLQRRTPLSPGSKPLSRGNAPLANGSQPLASGKPLERRSPLASGNGPKRTAGDLPQQRTEPRKSLPAQSKKRAAEMPLRRKVVRTILAIQPICVAPRCQNPSQDVHERKTRGRGGSPVNPFNTVGLCRGCHEAVTGEAAWAYPAGLLLHGWDPEPDSPMPQLTPMQQAAVRRVVTEDWWPTTPYDVEKWWETAGREVA